MVLPTRILDKTSQPTEERISKRREEWNNHVSRMKEDRIVTVMIDNIPKGRISPGEYLPEGGLVRPKHVAIKCDFNDILK
jgi:hypothetical protein